MLYCGVWHIFHKLLTVFVCSVVLGRHSIDMEKQGCGQCWIIKPVAPQGQCGNFGTCILKGTPPVILMMSVSEPKGSGHQPEISNQAFKNGLAAFKNDGDNICNDLVDGKWSWDYQPYVNADLGCVAH